MIENIIYASRHDNAPHRLAPQRREPCAEFPPSPRILAGNSIAWTLSGLALAACGGGGGGVVPPPSSPPGSTASLAVRVLQSAGFVADDDGLVNYQVPASANRAATIPDNDVLLIIGGTGNSRDGITDGILGSSSDYTRTGDCPGGGSTCTFTVTELTITLRSDAPDNIAALRREHVDEINLMSTMMQVSGTDTGMGTFNVRIDFTDPNGDVSYYTVDADGSGSSITPQTITVLASTHEMNPTSNPLYDFSAGISDDNQVFLNLLLGQQDTIVYDVEYLNANDSNSVITGLTDTTAQDVMRTALGTAGITVRFKVSAPNDATPDVDIALYGGPIGGGTTQLVSHRDVAAPDGNGVYTHTFTTAEIGDTASFVRAEFNVNQDGFTANDSAANYGDGLGVEIV